MTDADWGDLDQIPSKKQSSKLIFCGLGCLIPLVLLALGGLWLKGWIDEARDPEVQWENLRELVDFDQRPEGWQMQLGIQAKWIKPQVFILTSTDEQEMTATFLQLPAERRAEMFDRALEGVSPWTPPGAEEPIEFIEVQGRQLQVVLLNEDESKDPDSDEGPGVSVITDGRAVAVDLSAEGSSSSVVLALSRTEEQPLAPEDIVAFLEPFHVGPER